MRCISDNDAEPAHEAAEWCAEKKPNDTARYDSGKGYDKNIDLGPSLDEPSYLNADERRDICPDRTCAARSARIADRADDCGRAYRQYLRLEPDSDCNADSSTHDRSGLSNGHNGSQNIGKEGYLRKLCYYRPDKERSEKALCHRTEGNDKVSVGIVLNGFAEAALCIRFHAYFVLSVVVLCIVSDCRIRHSAAAR